MKTTNISILLLLLVNILFWFGCDQTTNYTNFQDTPPHLNSQVNKDKQLTDAERNIPEIVPGHYVVVFKDQGGRQISPQAAEEAELRIHSILSDLSIEQDSLTHQYKYALKGFAARLSEEQVQQLEEDPRVDLVAPDFKYRATQFRFNLPFNDAVFDDPGGQIVPWGVARIGGGTRVVGKKAWIIDTGIDLNHPELYVDTNNSIAFLKGYQGTPSAQDEDGHGTFIAGIIAAKEDPQGSIVGVAADATVVSVRVCDGDGVCYSSDIKKGVDHVASKYSVGEVANISLGFKLGVDYDGLIDTALSVLEDAIKTAADDGLMFTIAAGNTAEDANNYSPARIVNQNVWTISAFDENDNFASFSNFGNPPIDFSAPGVDILSLAIGGGTIVDSGTSFAAPHFAGLLLIDPNNIGVNGTVYNDQDNDPDLIAVNGNSFPGLSVSLSGPSILDSGEEGTWIANANHGTGNYTYQWYYQNDSGSPWQTGGTNSSYSHTFYNTNNDPIYAAVKVVVEDGFSDPVEGYEYIYIEGDCTDPMTCPGW